MSLRHRFPGLSDGWARLDGAAGTLMVDSAIEATAEFLRSPANSNLGGPFDASARCEEVVEGARARVGELLGADPAQVVFGPNSTTLVLGFTRALGRTMGPGDRIVCTRLDHDSNVSTWQAMAADVGAEVVLWPITDDGRLDPSVLADLLAGGGVRWVAVSGCSNLTGYVPPVAEIVALAHEHGARVHLDAVARVPHLPTHAGALGVDSMMSSAYKWYGPHVGVLVLADELLGAVEPYRVRPADYVGNRRFETGTPAFEQLAAVSAAAGFMIETSGPELVASERSLLERLESGLASLPEVTTYRPGGGGLRAPTTIFNVGDRRPEEVAAHLATRRVAVWPGHSYAIELIDALGLTERGGAVRASIVRYDDEADVDRLLEALGNL